MDARKRASVGLAARTMRTFEPPHQACALPLHGLRQEPWLSLAAMNYQQLIEFILRRAHETLWANLPPQSRLSDAKAVATIRELVSSPTARKAIERGSDTLCAFALRALNRIVCGKSRSPADIITQLWDIVDEP